MNKKEIAIDTTTALATQLVTVSSLVNPATSLVAVTALAGVAGFSKRYLGIKSKKEDLEQLAMQLQETRTAQEIMKMDESKFLDDLLFSLEKILKQRTAPKRLLMRNVFLGYINAEYKNSYPLERMYTVVENLTFADIMFFRRVFDATELRKALLIPFVSKEIMDNHSIPEDKQQLVMLLTHTDNLQDQFSRESLVTAGLLINQNRGVGAMGAGEGTPQLYITNFGKYFKDYLVNIDEF